MAKSTGNQALDAALNQECNLLHELFRAGPNLLLFDDSQGHNALATSDQTLAGTEGTLYIGVNLLREELWRMDRGPFAVAGILAHEFTHIVQMKEESRLSGPERELHADFMAGFYLGRRGLKESDLLPFANSLFAKGDTAFRSPEHHGTPAQRVEAMLAGFRMQARPLEEAWASGEAHAQSILGDEAGTATNDGESGGYVRQNDDPDAQKLFDRARSRDEAGNFDGAIADLDAVIRMRPNSAAAFNNRGWVRIHAGPKQLERAIADFNEALRLQPGYAEALNGRGRAKLQTGDLDGARADVDRSIAIKPISDAFVVRGAVKAKQGDMAGAIADFGQAIAIWKENPEAFARRARAKRTSGDNAGALTDLDNAIRLSDVDPGVRLERGILRALAGDKPRALEDFTRATAMDPEDPYPAIWALAFGGGRSALENLAEGTDWEASLARFCLGRMSSNDLVKAAKQADSEAEIKNQLCEAHGYIGLFYERKGDMALAKQAYEYCVATQAVTMDEYYWARARLGGSPGLGGVLPSPSPPASTTSPASPTTSPSTTTPPPSPNRSCGNCGTAAASGGRFCTQCGKPLPLTCATCGGNVSESDRFCAHCGTKRQP